MAVNLCGRAGTILANNICKIKLKHNVMKAQNKQLLTALAECAAACNMCATACLEEKDIRMMVACIRLDIDCAQICQATAGFVSRGSDHAVHLLTECAEICTKCAGECAKHQNDHCQTCAEACRKCAEACKAGL